MYEPKPIDTSAIDLPAGIEPLMEKLAAHNHDVWARRRMDEGWSYGPTRDDEKKTNPDLVPYEQLPESERRYDRQTASEILKAIIALGYRLEKG